jgi:hypothetical protein
MDEFIPGFEDPDDDFSGFYDDDGNKLNPDLVNKPSLCLLCIKDDDQFERVLCTLNRLDQDDNEFKCFAYQPKKEHNKELS